MGTPGKREGLLHAPQTCPDSIAFDNDENLYIGVCTQ